MWILLLISVKLFLRSGEATGDTVNEETGGVEPTGLQISSFDFTLSSVENGTVNSVAVRVKGLPFTNCRKNRQGGKNINVVA
jgi:hypothetical protein